MLTILLFFFVIQSNNKKLSFGIHWDMKVAALQKKYITHMHDKMSVVQVITCDIKLFSVVNSFL